jgi:hypothetical protein
VSFFDTTVGEPPEVQNPNADLAAEESGYIAPDVETDQDAIAQEVYANLTARVPGWVAHDGNLDTWLVEAWSEVGAEIRSLAADVPASIFATYGTRVLGLPPGLAVGATGLASFTATDTAGYTLDTGATFGLSRSGNDVVAYQTLQEADIAPGDLTVDNVPFTAVEVGSDANGLSGQGQMLDPIGWVQTVTVTAPTSGGADAETPEDYVDRLSNLFPSVALRPILPMDFAVLALQLYPNDVGRAVAMNLYDPVAGTWTNARTVTLMLTQADGTPCTPAVKSEVAATLESLREVNWVVHVIDPTYEAISVAFTVVAFAGQDATVVHDAAVVNLTQYLQPSNFRLGEMSPAIAGGEVIYPPTAGQPTRRQVVRLNEVIALLDRSLGVDYVQTVTINGAATDHQFTQPYSLPTPGTITGTVTGANP